MTDWPHDRCCNVGGWNAEGFRRWYHRRLVADGWGSGGAEELITASFR